MVLITLILLVIVRLIMCVLMVSLITWMGRWGELERARRRWDQARLTNIETQMHHFVRLIERSLATRLRAQNDPYMNALLRKLDDGSISPGETAVLHRLLQERIDELTIDEPVAATVALPRVLTLWALEFRMYLGKESTRYQNRS